MVNYLLVVAHPAYSEHEVRGVDHVFNYCPLSVGLHKIASSPDHPVLYFSFSGHPGPSVVPRPRGEKRVAWYSLFAHVRPFPEKPGNPRMFGNCLYNRYIYVRFISVSSTMAASLLILLACSMVFRQIDAQKVSVSSTLGSCLPLKSLEGQICD